MNNNANCNLIHINTEYFKFVNLLITKFVRESKMKKHLRFYQKSLIDLKNEFTKSFPFQFLFLFFENFDKLFCATEPING